jgi:hypothetical protein
MATSLKTGSPFTTELPQMAKSILQIHSEEMHLHLEHESKWKNTVFFY